VAALERQLAKGDKALIGNTGFRRYLKTISDEHFAIDTDKIAEEKKFDGIFVLRTNTDLTKRAVGDRQLRRRMKPAPFQIEQQIAPILGTFTRLCQFGPDRADKTRIPGKPQDVIHRMSFAPRHQRLARKAGVGAHNNARLRPARPDLANNALDFLDRASSAIDIRTP
jgi:hypothetical protein